MITWAGRKLINSSDLWIKPSPPESSLSLNLMQHCTTSRSGPIPSWNTALLTALSTEFVRVELRFLHPSLHAFGLGQPPLHKRTLSMACIFFVFLLTSVECGIDTRCGYGLCCVHAGFRCLGVSWKSFLAFSCYQPLWTVILLEAKGEDCYKNRPLHAPQFGFQFLF